MENQKEQIVVIPLGQLTELIKSSVDSTMEKWLERKVKQEREDKENEEATITMQQLMEQFHIGRTAVYSRIKDGVLKPIRMGSRILFIKRDVLEAYKSGKMERYKRPRR